MPKILLLGAGNSKKLSVRVKAPEEGEVLVTLDMDERCSPDVLHDLNNLPYPFEDSEFDQIHAYEVMEHLGTQGDWKFFFNQFTELARISKPEGVFVFTCPKRDSIWLWGDPGHTRYIGPESITFLSQANYVLQVGETAMTDYRHIYKADWRCEGFDQDQLPNSNIFLLVNKKEI